MGSVGGNLERDVLEWYARQHPLTVDIVGDFAGRELFVIHGESLIRHCLAKSKVDFNGGFQLLHAVYAVEDFLSNLHKRGCNFDVIFFRDLVDLSAPAGTAEKNVYKYRLVRSILIQHLGRSATDCKVLEYDSFEAPAWRDYLKNHAIHFALCHDGEVEGEEAQTTRLRYLIAKFISDGRNVAIINTLAWKSSKIFTPLMSGSARPLPFVGDDGLHVRLGQNSLDCKPLSKNIDNDDIKALGLSVRESLAVIFCREFLARSALTDQSKQRIHALLLHTAMLGVCSLASRVCREPRQDLASSSEDQAFLRNYAEMSHALIRDGLHMSLYVDCHDPKWDLYDFIDGRLFFLILNDVKARESLTTQAVAKANVLWEAVASKHHNVCMDVVAQQTPNQGASSANTIHIPSLLEFSHPSFNDYLDDVKVIEVRETLHPKAQKTFEDLHHWHVFKSVNNIKQPAVLDFRALKRNQKYMARIVAYAASLNNLQGKALDREIIVVGANNVPNKSSSKAKVSQSEVVPKPSKGKISKTSGKERALQAAQDLRNKKMDEKRKTMLDHWDNTCLTLQKDDSLVSQYIKADKYLLSRTPEHKVTIESSVRLFLCRVLEQLWNQAKTRKNQGKPGGLYLIAMMWRLVQDITRAKSYTPEIARALERLAGYLRITTPPVPALLPNRQLPFQFRIEAAEKATELEPRVFQLQYCGPYLDRRFDSKADHRVPFEPDGWQRKVLDSIDANESLLVVAPTSAGKTFISFYAMKKALQESDDAVLVYVAPTKALVNQIAAEIEARFSKSYRGKEGKSVWAIHTRDYRINNPSGCQVLVTVPHILQIMLLAPTNANGPNAWSKRVRRIIFDEVHCIGQAEDGVVWEQLLLLAPCPIIALSATVGNPEGFRDWLAAAQAQKGHKMTMVIHRTRYSDLRKFIYRPPREFVFGGLDRSDQLPVPGLDEGNLSSPNFQFVHPVTALKDRHRGALEDVDLEARDCLTLWQKLEMMQLPQLQEQVQDLHPLRNLPEIISKSDVTLWEKKLKTALKKVMGIPETPFPALQAELSMPLDGRNEPAEVLEGQEDISHVSSLFSLACELHALDALPALVFHYDRIGCETAVKSILAKLELAEESWKAADPEWIKKLRQFKEWKKSKSFTREVKGLSQDDRDEGMSKSDLVREAANEGFSPWESFDPSAPLEQFTFADFSKLQRSELEVEIDHLEWVGLNPWLIEGLRRGLGVHHAGMNLHYRRVVEVLFRKGYLRLVVATGTLALGINMPCKTVVFSGDSVFLTTQNYRQGSGRAGRRGFDLLGNVVFNGISEERVHEIMSSRLPELRGQFPISTTLVLRLFGLLHGTDCSDFARDAVQSLLSQTRLYLGGPESVMSIKHHLRFSIEYLRRQNLLSSTGEPLNFAGMVGHLYFTENAVFALHSLLRGGYFHELCAGLYKHPGKVLLEIMLVLSHIFSRVPVRRTKELVQEAHRSPSLVFLPRLPQDAEKMLIEHNQETLAIFKDYVQSYINQHLIDKPDQCLPFTKITVGGDTSGSLSTAIRSPFVALSGLTDDFESIHELCSTARAGVFLEESAIPFIPIWPHDTDTELNAYVYDFYKNGSLEELKRDNKIKAGDVWFFLKDFHLTLKTIVTSLRGFVTGDDEMLDVTDDMTDLEEEDELGVPEQREHAPVAQGKAATRKKAKVLDSWEDDESDAASESTSEEDVGSSPEPTSLDGLKKNGFADVLSAFAMLETEFGLKLQKVAA